MHTGNIHSSAHRKKHFCKIDTILIHDVNLITNIRRYCNIKMPFFLCGMRWHISLLQIYLFIENSEHILSYIFLKISIHSSCIFISCFSAYFSFILDSSKYYQSRLKLSYVKHEISGCIRTLWFFQILLFLYHEYAEISI